MELTLQNLKDNRIKCNIEKLFFGKTKMEYLGFWVTRNGIRPIKKKLEAIVTMKPPTRPKQARGFIGLLNYYRDVWDRRSHLLHPLTALQKNKVKFKLTDVKTENV